jgi:hypothetical protein
MSNERRAATSPKSAEEARSSHSSEEAKLPNDDEIREKIHADGFEKYLNDEETMGMLYFLYRRKFYEHQ